MLIYPLASGYDIGKSAINTVMSSASGITGALTGIGASIASIFILFVVFQGIASILEGGKFQVKMLGPVVIYILVCNFSIVATPTRSFFEALQSGTVAQMKSANDGLYDGKTKLEKFKEAYRGNNAAAIEELDEALKDAENFTIEIEDSGGGDDAAPHKKFLGIDITAIGNNITASIKSAWNWIRIKFIQGFLHFRNDDDSWGNMILSIGFPFVLSVLLDWFVQLLTIVMTALGGILVGVAMAFGPISWAFGVIPGNHRVILTWFIRVCQFALYSPLCGLVNYFSSVIFLNLIGGSPSSILGLVAVLLCNLVLLTSIPSLASQIIEGASGGMSISQGVQTLASPFTMLGSMSMMGERGRDQKQQDIGQQQLNTLKEISTKLGGSPSGGQAAPGADTQGGGPSGQNPH